MAISGLLDQLPIAQAAPIVRQYNEQLTEAQAKYPGRFYGTANIPLNDTSQAIAMVDEAVKEFGLVGVYLPVTLVPAVFPRPADE